MMAPELRREDIPPELRPLFDQLSFEIQRAGTTADELHRQVRQARCWRSYAWGVATALLIVVVVFAVRHIS